MITILIVDDEKLERRGIRFLLKREEGEFQILEATNGKDALGVLESNHVDILFSDVKMPYMNGLELTKAVREDHPDMEIVIFSGYNDFSYAREALRYGVVDYVLKPEVIEWMADAVMAYQEREANSAVLLGLRDQLSENQRATANLMKAIEAGIITLTTKGRLVELEAEASRLRDAITLEEAAQTHIERDFMVYWFEKFRGGDLEDAAFRRRVIDSFVNAVYLWDDRLRVAFNYSGKGSAVDMELVMDAEALAGPEGRFVLAPPASTNGEPGEPGTAIYFVGPVFILALPLPRRR